ncbi:MAG: AAA family ATPase [Planctomycetota bacterium]
MTDSTYSIDIALRLREQVLDPIGRDLVGKREIIEVLAVALVAGENAFLLGPPGTGKSALVQELAMRIDGRSFDYLLTKFTEPSELFGPFDLRKLREGELVTNVEGMLPEADFVFLDELFNANSAILNSVLLALNERVFRRGRETMKLPMLMAVGASNWLPDDEALSALYDRFLLRVQCENVDDALLSEVLEAGWRRQHRAIEPGVTVDEIRSLQRQATAVSLVSVQKAYVELVTRLRKVGIPLSDRRAVRMQRAIAASAVLSGRAEADISDLWVMETTWDTPAQIEILKAQVMSVREEFSSDESPSIPSERVHPMADRNVTPDAEQLSQIVERIAGEADHPTAAEALGLIAARVPWVTNANQRVQLEERIEEVRGLIGNST